MRYTVHRAFKDLGAIDKAHESGRITKAQHDSQSRTVLKKLVGKTKRHHHARQHAKVRTKGAVRKHNWIDWRY